MEKTINVDGNEIMLVFGRLKKEAFYELEAKKQELKAAGIDLSKGGPELSDLIVGTVMGMVRKIWGDFPGPEESVDVQEFMFENSIITEGEMTGEQKIDFIKSYYFQDIITFAGELLGPSRPVVRCIKSEREASKNLSSGSVSISTGSTSQPGEDITKPAKTVNMEKVTSTFRENETS